MRTLVGLIWRPILYHPRLSVEVSNVSIVSPNPSDPSHQQKLLQKYFLDKEGSLHLFNQMKYSPVVAISIQNQKGESSEQTEASTGGFAVLQQENRRKATRPHRSLAAKPWPPPFQLHSSRSRSAAAQPIFHFHAGVCPFGMGLVRNNGKTAFLRQQLDKGIFQSSCLFSQRLPRVLGASPNGRGLAEPDADS